MARQRSIYNTGSYSTPLADFLDEIPDYFLKFEQLKQAESERAEQTSFRNKQYSDQIAQQTKNNIYRNEQAKAKKINDDLKTDMSFMGQLDNPTAKQQYFKHMIATNPEYDEKDVNAFSQALDVARTTGDSLDNLLSKRDEFSRTGTRELYGNYQEIVDLASDLEGMRKKVNPKNKASLNQAISDVGLMVKTLETTSGREMSVKDMSNSSQVAWKGIKEQADDTRESFLKAEDALAGVALKTRGKDGKEMWIVQPSFGTKVTDTDRDGFSKLKRTYDFSKNRRDKTQEQLNNFTKDRNLFYPKITTAKQQEELDAQSEVRTSWFNENEDYINSSPQTAELLISYLSDPSNADRFSELQESTRQQRELDKIDINDSTVQSSISVINKKREGLEPDINLAKIDEEIPDDVPDAWKELATEPMPEDGITDEVLADAPREPEPTPERDIDIDLPSVVEPLSARSDRETESFIDRKEKESAETPLFKEPVKIEDLKSMDINDSKGNPITFESTKEFDKQINSMYSEIKNIGKKLTQSGSSREQRAEMRESQKRISKDLIKTLGILNISNDVNTKDKNLKSTMSQFLKNKKFRDSDALINFLQNYI